MSLRPREVITPSDCEHFRLVRNEGYETFAYNQEPISYADNLRFWSNERGKTVWGWLYINEDNEIVAAGSLQRKHKRLWAFVAVSKESRGRGYGVEVLQHLVGETSEPVWAVHLSDNAGSASIHRKAGGWTKLAESDGKVVLVYREGRHHDSII